MIRPITVFCGAMALGSGLYLYHAKHDVELMDKRIDQIAKETAGIRAESRHLLDEWIGLGEPEQLRKYSDQYLGLKSIGPTQFLRLADLPARLPPPRAPDVIGQPETPEPSGAVATEDDTSMSDADDLPVPPIPPPGMTAGTSQPGQTDSAAAKPRLADDAHAPVLKPLAAKSGVAAPVPLQAPAPVSPQAFVPPSGQGPVQARPADLRVPDPRTADAMRDSRQPRPQAQAQAQAPVPAPPQARQPPRQAWVLGMPRGDVPAPLPAPTPVSATWPGR